MATALTAACLRQGAAAAPAERRQQRAVAPAATASRAGRALAASRSTLRPRQARRGSALRVAAADLPGDFSIPAAPILIPEGPWKEIEGSVCAPKGFKAQGMYGGLRAKGTKADLALIVADVPAVAAGVFTLNVMCAAPVTYCKEVLGRRDSVRAVLVNAGQANAATGEAGYADSLASADAVAAALGVERDDVLLESTGVIGRRIKMEPLLEAVPRLAGALGGGKEDAHRAAVAITTTDLVSKSAALEVELSPGRTVRLGGIAKGSGMIHPNMATMLAVLTCDAPVTPEVWRGMFKRGSINSFNQITVDGDTSTNDTVIGLASGLAGGPVISDAASPEAQKLEAAVTALLQGLAKSIAWDGEGATVLIECEVLGAASQADANRVAKSVVGSSLAKSAIFGHDPNWGRIAAAAGYSGVQYDQGAVRIVLGDMVLMDKGQPLPFDEKAASAYLKGRADCHGTVNIQVSIGDGPGRGMAWGCDLSYDYVKDADLLDEHEQMELIGSMERAAARQRHYSKALLSLLGLAIAALYAWFAATQAMHPFEGPHLARFSGHLRAGQVVAADAGGAAMALLVVAAVWTFPEHRARASWRTLLSLAALAAALLALFWAAAVWRVAAASAAPLSSLWRQLWLPAVPPALVLLNAAALHVMRGTERSVAALRRARYDYKRA